MRNGKRLLALIVFLISFCFSSWGVWVFSTHHESADSINKHILTNPSEAVRLYWQLSKEGKFEEAGSYAIADSFTKMGSCSVSNNVEHSSLDKLGLQSVQPPIMPELNISRKHFFRIEFPQFIHEKGLEIRETQSEIINSGKATVIVRVSWKEKNINFNLEHHLCREGDNWKIRSVQMLYGQ